MNWPAALAALKPLGSVAAGQTVLIHAAAVGTGQARDDTRPGRRLGPRLPQRRYRRRGPAADQRYGCRPGAEVSWRDTLGASLAAARRVTGLVVVYGTVGGEAAVTNWELVYRYQVQVIGLNIGVLIQAAPQIFGEVMGELSGLMAVGVLTLGQPTAYELADGPKALAELEARATVGKLTLLP